MVNVLIVGATRGLGSALVSYYSQKASTTVYATARSAKKPEESRKNVRWITEIDLMQSNCGKTLATLLEKISIDTAYITAGFFATEDFGKGPDWDNEVKMYTTSSIAPVFIVHALAQSNLSAGSKVILISSESGSIGLRHQSEGGGNYGHHGSKSASNMIGRLLALDLKDKSVAVGIIHPSFMRTEMTKNIGFDQYWDDGGALKPEEAAKITATWVDQEFSMQLSGQYWAPRGTRDIGTWEAVNGKGSGKDAPVRLPW